MALLQTYGVVQFLGYIIVRLRCVVVVVSVGVHRRAEIERLAQHMTEAVRGKYKAAIPRLFLDTLRHPE